MFSLPLRKVSMLAPYMTPQTVSNPATSNARSTIQSLPSISRSSSSTSLEDLMESSSPDYGHFITLPSSSPPTFSAPLLPGSSILNTAPSVLSDNQCACCLVSSFMSDGPLENSILFSPLSCWNGKHRSVTELDGMSPQKTLTMFDVSSTVEPAAPLDGSRKNLFHDFRYLPPVGFPAPLLLDRSLAWSNGYGT